MRRRLVSLLMLATSQILVSPVGAQQHRFVETLERLAIKLPDVALANNNVYRALDQLSREPCDQQAIVGLGSALEKVGCRREAANAHVGFSRACRGQPASLRRAVNILLGLSDSVASISVATELIELEPLIDNGYFLRAVAYERGGDSKKAIDDYITATQLFPDKDQIANNSYFAMARLHDKLGQPCDAASAIASWVAHNARNDSSQTRTAIANYSSKGNCKIAKNDSDEVIANSRPGNVAKLTVSLNGTRGTFVLDTGASFVSIRSSFAQKAKIEVDDDSSIQLHTANGVTAGKRGRAKSVQLRSLEAKDVAIVVQPDDKATYGPGVDGLLGMSFLSRFNVTIDRNSIRISSRAPR